MHARRRPTWIQRVSVVVAGAILALVLAAQVAQAATSPLRYVALGDSYSAASGVLLPDLSAPPQCLRSVRNYPHVIAGATGAQLTDVTCGAAETSDYFESQSPGVAPQLDALKQDTQLVTMTIGGNDSGVFIGTIISCGTAGLSTLGQGSPCKDRYGTSFEDTLNTTTYPSLVKSLEAVKVKAPEAEVAILGYPWIMPATGGCFDKMPIAQGDVPYVRGIQATLNDAIRRAAAATGATYVNLDTASNGHDACQPIGVRWVEPVLQGTNPVIVHPNALGESQMAAQTMTVLGLH
jgi:lysophospholipase L1-like esterase